MQDRIAYQGITFDDVLLEPAYSDVVPRDVDVRTRLSRNIRLNLPIVSSPMDTVTESDLAIALAQEGGIGIIHKNLPIADQTNEVDKVKRSENGIITDPITLPPDETVGTAKGIMEQHKISGVPITVNGFLKGILTRRDLRFLTNMNQRLAEVMTKDNLVTASEHTTLETAERILTENKVEKLLLVDDKYKLKGLITIKDIDKLANFPNACKDRAAGCASGRRWASTTTSGRSRSSAPAWTCWWSIRPTAIRRTSSKRWPPSSGRTRSKSSPETSPPRKGRERWSRRGPTR